MTVRYSIATPTANSYVSVGSANTYFQTRYDSDSWTAISSGTNSTAANEIKGNILIQATREIDNTFRFFGEKYNAGIRGQSDYQALEFPKSHDVDVNSTPYILDEVKYATYEQAIFIAKGKRGIKTDNTATFTTFNGVEFSQESYNYLRPMIKRTVKMTGQYPPFKSAF